MEESMIQAVIKGACPSIQYRLRKELLGEATNSREMVRLQAQILADPVVREVISWQQPDGWLGWNFHGAVSCETGIRILAEKGMEPDHPVMAGALQSLEAYPDRLERGIGRPGALLDASGLGGQQMIRAATTAQAGSEDKAFIQDQIKAALDGMEAMREVGSLEALLENRKGVNILRKGIPWPSIYHLRLLAWTHAWRTQETMRTVQLGIRQLVHLSPIPEYKLLAGSQLVAPASFCMHDFKPDMESMDSAGWMMWFHRMEVLARLGVVKEIPELAEQVDTLERMLQQAQGRFALKLNHPYFRNWGAYSGMMLEADWRRSSRRESDLTFRSLLILAYAEK